MSNITKHALSGALKKLLSKHALTAITVQNIVDEAGVSRKTFYYHFRDIYDLTEWTMQEEFQKILAGNQTLDTWQEGVKNLLNYIVENRNLILNLLLSLDDDFITEELREVVKPLMLSVYQELPGFRQLSEDDQQFFSMVQIYGCIGVLLDWIREGMQIPQDVILARFVHYFSLASQFLGASPDPDPASGN